MEISKEILQQTAKAGSEKTAESMKNLTGTEISVSVSGAESITFESLVERIFDQGDAFLVYTPIYSQSDISGLAVLTIAKNDMIILADMLKHQEVGTTKTIDEIDESAIKETLNILANSYLNALAAIVNTEIRINAPKTISKGDLKQILAAASAASIMENDKPSTIFETMMEYLRQQTKVQLYLLFNKHLAQVALERESL
jgi:chemotaxis protein CheY-P-specific phosphatase CheC